MLYRGECLEKHSENDGEICPKGDKPAVAPRYDGDIVYDGKFRYGESEEYAVRAHQLERVELQGCWISTTLDYQRAKHHATSGNTSEGVIYTLDESLFEEFGVIVGPDVAPPYPREQEVSIRSSDCGPIPREVVVAVEHVKPDTEWFD